MTWNWVRIPHAFFFFLQASHQICAFLFRALHFFVYAFLFGALTSDSTCWLCGSKSLNDWSSVWSSIPSCISTSNIGESMAYWLQPWRKVYISFLYDSFSLVSSSFNSPILFSNCFSFSKLLLFCSSMFSFNLLFSNSFCFISKS